MEQQLAEARNYASRPNDPDTILWLGRRLAYPGRFREAIEIFGRHQGFPGTRGSIVTGDIATSRCAGLILRSKISRKPLR